MSTSTTSRCCRERAGSCELFLTAGWHYRRMSQRSGYYQAQTTTPARPDDDAGSCKNRSCGVYFLSVGLLQLAAPRSAGHSTAQAAVCAECHCTTDHWHATQWSYLAGITRTPLAAHPRALQVRTGVSGSPVTVRAGASLLGRRLPSRVRQHSALSV